MGLFSFFKEQILLQDKFDEFELINQQLVDAVFKPMLSVRKLDPDMSGKDELKWKAGDKRYWGFEFLNDLYDLSEFYIEFNPILSSALWGVWNAYNYTQHSYLNKQFKQDDDGLRGYINVVAIAVYHYADGNPYTTVTDSAYFNTSNLEKYRSGAEESIEHMNKLEEKIISTYSA